MNTGQRLLKAVADQPEDDPVRLVYSDWLEDQGENDRAEFIRLQIEMERLPENDPKRYPLGYRQEELLKRRYQEWPPEVPPETHFTFTFRRGFLDQLRVCSNEQPTAIGRFVPRALRQCPTIRSLAFGDLIQQAESPSVFVGWDDNPPRESDTVPTEPFIRLLRLACLKRIVHFRFIACYLPRSVCDLLAQARTLTGLRVLDLTGMGINAAEMADLLQAAWFPQLHELRAAPGSHFHDSIGMGHYSETIPIRDEALVLLAQSPAVRNLRRLIIPRYESKFSARVVVALLNSPHLGQLEQLELGNLRTWLDDSVSGAQLVNAVQEYRRRFPRSAAK